MAAPTSIPSLAKPAEPKAPDVQGSAPSSMPSMMGSVVPGQTALDGIPSLQKPSQSALSKFGHGLEKVGEIAGSAVAPGLFEKIPGTTLNKEFEQNRADKLAGEEAETGLKNAQAGNLEKQGEEIDWTPLGETEPVKVRFGDIGRLESGKQRALASEENADTRAQTSEQNTGATIASREKVAGENNEEKEKANQTREDIAGQSNATREAIAAEQAQAAERRVSLQNETRKQIAAEHEAAAAGTAGSPGKLTAANKGRAEFAGTVLEQLPPIYKEIDDIKDKIGPAAGRWNDFWVNKGGINDPAYAGLDQDLGLLASAVAVMHFGARGGGQAFIQSLKKDFGEAQSPEDLKARIESASKWAKGYQDMGQPKNTPGGGDTVTMYRGGKEYNIPKGQEDAFTKAGGSKTK